MFAKEFLLKKERAPETFRDPPLIGPFCEKVFSLFSSWPKMRRSFSLEKFFDAIPLPKLFLDRPPLPVEFFFQRREYSSPPVDFRFLS